MTRRHYSSVAVDTTISSGITDAATSVTVAAATGFPSSTPWTAIIDKGTANEEIVEVTGVAGTTLTITRGVDGSTGVAHSSGAAFQHGVSARDLDEPNAHVNTTSGNPHSVTASDVGAVDATGDTMTGPLLLPNGSVSAPALAPSGDTDTGIYFGSAEVSIATGGTQRVKVNSAGLITGTGTSLGAWTAYTPTLSGTGWAIGNGTVSGSYCQVGKVVHFQGAIVFGSTSTFGAAGTLGVSLPVTAAGSGFEAAMGHARYLDDSPGNLYVGGFRGGGSTSVVFDVPGSGGIANYVTSTGPFTWASGDKVYYYGSYQAA